MEVFLASLGTLGIVAGYALVKRFSRSNCHSDSGCLQCESPAVELHKANTVRLEEQKDKLDELFEIIKKSQAPGPGSPKLLNTTEVRDPRVPTTLIEKFGDN